MSRFSGGGRNIKKTTARSIVDVLFWIETKQHHITDATDKEFFVLRGYWNQLRIPTEVGKAAYRYMEPARDPFDTRAYRAKPSGKRLLRKAGRMPEIEAIQAHRKGE